MANGGAGPRSSEVALVTSSQLSLEQQHLDLKWQASVAGTAPWTLSAMFSKTGWRQHKSWTPPPKKESKVSSWFQETSLPEWMAQVRTLFAWLGLDIELPGSDFVESGLVYGEFLAERSE